ncbi:hypothetical protein [Streptomyces nigrescens]|uniref:Uncharacterized protein n=1 Tax=Streptomyces nigrescens TaxID=1920 RepID=A0ABY7JEY7_STRNI|nr:hypothetical protein [Streptomyces nigrescens]WAU09931.1 hypothetical protein STRNI_002206 [Streptomyces nigrescens]
MTLNKSSSTGGKPPSWPKPHLFKHFADPKPGYVADWSDLPKWQRETDADIFEAIEKAHG